MKITRRQLRQLIAEASMPLLEENKPKRVDYSEDMMQRVFGQLDGEFWSSSGDGSDDVLRVVGIGALKDLAKFIAKNPNWKAWYEKEVDDLLSADDDDGGGGL